MVRPYDDLKLENKILSEQNDALISILDCIKRDINEPDKVYLHATRYNSELRRIAYMTTLQVATKPEWVDMI